MAYRRWLTAAVFLAGIITSISIFAQSNAEFDRLDGTGHSKAKVDVIEWENNLEIHDNTIGKVLGMGAKIDDRTADKKVLVIAFRIQGEPKPLIRRAILGINLDKSFKLYKDPTEKSFNKFAFSSDALTAPWVPMKMDPAPTQWYPDGVEDGTPNKLTNNNSDNSSGNSLEPRNPASSDDAPTKRTVTPSDQPYTW